MIHVAHKKSSESKLRKKYPNCIVVDVTSNAKDRLVQLSPFYPHGDIPIPYSHGLTSKSVEGIWQGLKVFQSAGIDSSSFQNDTMKNIKRTVRKYGPPIGHQKGLHSKEILNYIDARIKIYLPSYLWVLENKVSKIIERLKEASKTKDIILLDYSTNIDIFNTKKPLSHAFLIKLFVEGKYPSQEALLAISQGSRDGHQASLFNTHNSVINSPAKEGTTVDLSEIKLLIMKNPLTVKDIKNHLKYNISSQKLAALLRQEKSIKTLSQSGLNKYTVA